MTLELLPLRKYILTELIHSRYTFRYDGFEWVHMLPAPFMEALFIILIISALLITTGLFTRPATITFFLGFTYLFLLDRGHYNNHYYLYSLLAFLMCWVKTDGQFSLQQKLFPKQSIHKASIPAWHQYLLMGQVFVVYFMGGIAKLDPDWLNAMQMKLWLPSRQDYWLIGPWLKTETAAYAFSYAGLIFDLSIGFLLLWKRTRTIALIPLIAFHLLNYSLWNIGLFPFTMLAATILFFIQKPSGIPTSGTPKTSTPTSGIPTSGIPTSGTPKTGTPTSGTPKLGIPTSGTPTSGIPTSGTPKPSIPTSGTPKTGIPKPSHPAKASHSGITAIAQNQKGSTKTTTTTTTTTKSNTSTTIAAKTTTKTPSTNNKSNTQPTPSQNRNRILPRTAQFVTPLIVLWFTIQLLYPLRQHLYPGKTGWTGQGHLFAWRMMMGDHYDAARIWFGPNEDQLLNVDLNQYISLRQFQKASRTPKQYLKFAHYLRDEMKKTGVPDPVIKIEVYKQLNGRPWKLLLSPNKNLAKIPYSAIQNANWLEPFSE